MSIRPAFRWVFWCLFGQAIMACSDSTGPPSPGALTIEPTDRFINVGETTTFEARLWDVNGNPFENSDRVTVHWTADDRTVVQVLGEGSFKGLKGGTSTVRAAAAGLEATAVVHVVAPGSSDGGDPPPGD